MDPETIEWLPALTPEEEARIAEAEKLRDYYYREICREFELSYIRSVFLNRDIE